MSAEYIRDNIKNKEEIYLIITKNMENNLINKKSGNIFIDCTYKIIHPNLKKYKFFVILGYDKDINKLILYSYALIRNENKEN